MLSSTMSAAPCSKPCGGAWPTTGRIVLVGQVTGDFITLNPAQLFLRNVSILSAKGVSRAQLADALELVARRRIKPVDRETFASRWKMPQTAHRAGRAGRVILRPAGGSCCRSPAR